MVNDYMDEWGFRKIDGVLEDGRRILIAVAAPIIKTWTALLNTGHVFTRPIRLMKLTQALNTSHVYLRHRFMRLSQTLRTLHAWTLPIPTFLKQWFATLQTVHVFTRPFRRIGYTQQLQPAHVFRRPVRLIKFPAFLQPTHLFRSPFRLIKFTHILSTLHSWTTVLPIILRSKLTLMKRGVTLRMKKFRQKLSMVKRKMKLKIEVY